MAYRIEKRSSTKARGDYSIDFGDRNYSIPLCGCSNFDGEISTGDIIGVKLSANTTVKTKFATTSSLLPNEKIALISKQYGSYRPVEEHLFVVTKVHRRERIDVVPFFLDKDKVIAKLVEESFSTKWKIPVVQIEKDTLCEEMFINKSLKQYPIAEEYGYFTPFKAEKLFTLLDSVDETNPDIITGKDIAKLCPFSGHHYTKTILHLAKEAEKLQSFYNRLPQYEARLQHYLGEEYETVRDKWGTYELIVAHTEAMYVAALAMINKDFVKESVQHNLYIPSHLTVPTIHHNITRVKFSEIFRVYKPDPTYVLCRTKYVSNWGGVIVDNEIRKHVTTGNIVRVLFGKNKVAALADKYTYSGVIYCRILQRLNETQCLACIENYYCSEYEDIVLVINVNAISEVPFTWNGNESLEATGLDKESGEGFACTGGGAAVLSTAEGEVCTRDNDIAHEMFDLTYEALFA